MAQNNQHQGDQKQNNPQKGNQEQDNKARSQNPGTEQEDDLDEEEARR